MGRLTGFLIQLVFIAAVTLLGWLLAAITGSRRVGIAVAVLIAILALAVFIRMNWRDPEGD